MFSDPVVNEKFFGRNEILDLLAKRVRALQDGYRQNMAILGPQLIGKSSLILHFFSNFSHQQIVPIYVDLRANSFSHFIYKFLGAALYHYLKNKNIAVGEDLTLLKRYAQKTIPQTIKAVHKIEEDIKNSQFNRACEGLLNFTGILKQESGSPCIVILDEFHLLNTYKLKSPFASFAKEIMMQKDTMYILISSQVSYARKILAAELYLLFGNFEIVYLKPFDYQTSCKFLEKRFQDVNLPVDFKNFLFAFSEGHPFYLDILCNKILEKAKEFGRSEIDRYIISQAFNAVIYDSQGILNQYFSSLLAANLNGADYAYFIPILLSASRKGTRLSEICETTARQNKVIARQITYLLDKDLLAKFGVFFRIQDKIFRFWLQSVYQRKSVSFAADPVAESKEFSQEIEKRILAFTRETKKKTAEKIIELFKSFRNEIITIQNKNFKFWKFEEVRRCSFPPAPDCIIARYKDGCWICLISKEKISETQLQDFIYSYKKSRYKIRRAIIITFEEFDLNARLIALEHRIWIWNLADLNLILDLYGKQPIIKC